jgi:hypothetical protein
MMGLNKTVETSKEWKRSYKIWPFIDLGITEDDGMPVQNVEYCLIRFLLTMARI